MWQTKSNTLAWLAVGVILPSVALAQTVGARVVSAESRVHVWDDPLQEADGMLICHSTALCPTYDLNCDNFNDGEDLVILCCATNFGLPVEHASCPQADLDGDGIITGLDVARATSSACTQAHMPATFNDTGRFAEIDVPRIEPWDGDMEAYLPPEGVWEQEQIPIAEWEGDLEAYPPPRRCAGTRPGPHQRVGR